MKTAFVSLLVFSFFCTPLHAAAQGSSKPALQEAARLLEEGSFEAAAAAFEKLSAELRPGDHRAGSVWRGLGVSYANLGENEKAIHAFTACLEAEPRSALTHIYLGTCYSKSALYKTQFRGCEFFNGFRWTNHLAELKALLRRQSQPGKHYLEDAAALGEFYPEAPAELARLHGMSVPQLFRAS